MIQIAPAPHARAARAAHPQSHTRAIPHAGPQWMALRTRSRQEKVVARFLAASGIKHYLPLIERVSITRGRKHASRLPLFPGYIFLSGELEDAYSAVATKRACQIIHIRDQDRFIHELNQIQRALESGADLEHYPHTAVGRRCRIRRGPFRGIEGIVIERIKPTRLILHIDILGRGASLETDADSLEPCE